MLATLYSIFIAYCTVYTYHTKLTTVQYSKVLYSNIVLHVCTYIPYIPYIVSYILQYMCIPQNTTLLCLVRAVLLYTYCTYNTIQTEPLVYSTAPTVQHLTHVRLSVCLHMFIRAASSHYRTYRSAAQRHRPAGPHASKQAEPLSSSRPSSPMIPGRWDGRVCWVLGAGCGVHSLLTGTHVVVGACTALEGAWGNLACGESHEPCGQGRVCSLAETQQTRLDERQARRGVWAVLDGALCANRTSTV